MIVKTRTSWSWANSPDWWGEIEAVPIPLEEDRYILAVEVKEVNDVDTHNKDRQTVGGRYVWHHLIYRTQVGLDTPSDVELITGSDNVVNWPVHEVGRNPDYFDPKGAVLPRRARAWCLTPAHIHSSGSGRRSAPRVRLQVRAEGLQADLQARAPVGLGNGVDIDIKAMTTDQQLHAYTVLQQNMLTSFEPHLHAPGTCMRLEAIRGYNIQTLSCVGYDHNWVRGYSYADDQRRCC